jgi:hypothetical protein
MTDRSSSISNGPTWHANSCAYDAVLAVLLTIWEQDVDYWCTQFLDIGNDCAREFAQNMRKYSDNQLNINEVREALRRNLATASERCVYGSFACVSDILDHMFEYNRPITCIRYQCITFHPSQRSDHHRNSAVINNRPQDSVQNALALSEEDTVHACSHIGCPHLVKMLRRFVEAPQFLVIPIHSANTFIDTTVYISLEGVRCKYKLAGIIYYGNSHYTSRVIIDNHKCFYYDSMAYNGMFQWNSSLHSSNVDLSRCRGREATSSIYIKCTT